MLPAVHLSVRLLPLSSTTSTHPKEPCTRSQSFGNPGPSFETLTSIRKNPFETPTTPKPSAAGRSQLRPLASIVVDDVYPPQRTPAREINLLETPTHLFETLTSIRKNPFETPHTHRNPSATGRPQLRPLASIVVDDVYPPQRTPAREVNLLEAPAHPFETLTSIRKNPFETPHTHRNPLPPDVHKSDRLLPMSSTTSTHPKEPRARSQSFGNPCPSVRNAHLHSKKSIRNPPHSQFIVGT
uniref:Uncharacterized protein n=1 Tax=Cucumis sativus TaxID=3659 RepID=A0A0A0LWC3_CUCSA